MGMDSVELVLECEDAFQIRIPDADATVTDTVGQIQELCIRLVEEQVQSHPVSPEQQASIHEQVCVIVSECLGVKVQRVKPEARFIQDLGMH